MFDNHSQAANPAKVFVGNLAFTATEQQVEELFSQYGTIVSIRVVSDRQTGRPKGIAFVEFSSPEEAEAAIKALHGFEFLGRPLAVNVARPPAPRTGGYSSGGGGGYDRNSRSGGGRDNRGGGNRW